MDDADDSTSSGVSGIGAQSLAETDTANHLECPAAATAEVNSYTRSYTPNGAGNLTSTDLAYDDNGFTIVIP